MPGIYGFIKSGDMSKAKLSTAVAVDNPNGNLIQDELFDDNVIACSRSHINKIGEESTPLSFETTSIWVDGEAYNYKEVATKLGLNSSNFSKLLLESYQKDILDVFLNLIDGYFCAVFYDVAKKEITLVSDRYGMRMLYFYSKGSGIAWGSNVQSILAFEGVDKSFNDNSFDCFMKLGHLLGEETWFEHIKLIKPASIVKIDIESKAATHSHYWSWSQIKKTNLSFDDAVFELGKRFITAVEKRFNPHEKIGIALSGGLDSRAIFAAVCKIFPDYQGYSYTFGIKGCDDIKIAKKVIERSKWKHQAFYFDENNWFLPRIPRVINTDGMQDLRHMHGSEFMDKIADYIDINLNGYLGDAVFGGSYLVSSKSTDNNSSFEIANKIYKGFLKSDFLGDHYSIDSLDPILFMLRGRRFINMAQVNSSSFIEHRKPFMDNSCIELIYSLPEEYRRNNLIYSEMLKEFFPDFFRDIPWQQTGKPVDTWQKPNLLSKLILKANNLILAALGISRKSEFVDYASWIRTSDVYDELSSILGANNAIYKSLTNIDGFEDWLKPHKNFPLIDYSNKILRLATIEIYLQSLRSSIK